MGRLSLEERFGVERFKALTKARTWHQIAVLVCDHYPKDEDRANCKACKMAIWRAIKRIKEKEKAEKRYDPMDDFDSIPEIQDLREHLKAGKVKSIRTIINRLRRHWTWIRESDRGELIRTQRPALWDIPHVRFILARITDEKISSYGHKQALRRLFESLKRHSLLKDPLLKCRRRDMRPPNGSQRTAKQPFSPHEVPEILNACDNEDERFTIQMHITLKSREGQREEHLSLLGITWDQINWEDHYYGFPMVTVDVYEPKTGGGTWWRHCPVDLWFKDLGLRLRERWEKAGRPKEGFVFSMEYPEYAKLWLRISERIGKKLQAHDCRRAPAGWLRDLNLSDLAIGQYDVTTGEAVGFAGVGWENAENFYARYGKRNPIAIYDKSKRLDVSVFDGVIHRILENMAPPTRGNL